MLFGLTGGIASGKSTVASFMREQGVGVIDADQVAREVVVPGSEGLAELVVVFGEGILRSDGSLDRKALAARIFGDEPARRRLNALLHPRIRAASSEHVKKLVEQGHELIAYEAALLIEEGMQDSFRPLVVVVVGEQIQLQRLMARDKLTQAQASARLRAQMPMRQKAAVADFVIDTGTSLPQVREQTDRILRRLRARMLTSA